MKATTLALTASCAFTISILSFPAATDDLQSWRGLPDYSGEVSSHHGLPKLRPDPEKSERYIIKFKSTELLAYAGTPVTTGAEQLSEMKASYTQAAESVLSQHQAETIMHLDFAQASVAKLNQYQLQELAKHPTVEYIEQDHKRYIDDVKSLDTITAMSQTTPYGITMVQANQVSDANATTMKVCVIDSGYQLSHPDLPSAGVTGSTFSGHGAWSTDGSGHGTHVAGTIVALNNNIGVVGVLPSGLVGLHIVKIFNDSGSWTHASNLIQAVQLCQNAGANVVNMSLSGPSSNTTESNAMSNFYNNGMLLVATSGNLGNTNFRYPASYDAVISVAAVDANKNHASFSVRNSQVELSGPGVNVLSTCNNSNYCNKSGTSMAAPHVTGVAALVWSNHPQCTNAQIRNVLNQTAEHRGTSGRNNNFGWGIVQAKAAHDWITSNGCDGGGSSDYTWQYAPTFNSRVCPIGSIPGTVTLQNLGSTCPNHNKIARTNEYVTGLGGAGGPGCYKALQCR
ncbi:S8 family serine peptidase [Alkalimonas sp. NCh-2]|uniref:S8 family peptidase n=1 Tax=Alkalimonas sp. NCh-2 TaxID=3144846 RepID=UPI0031F67AA7